MKNLSTERKGSVLFAALALAMVAIAAIAHNFGLEQEAAEALVRTPVLALAAVVFWVLG